MIDENKDDELQDASLGMEIWSDCIIPLKFDTVKDAFWFVNAMNTQLSEWCASDKLSKYVYSLNIGFEDEDGCKGKNGDVVRDIRKEYIDLLTGIQSVQSIVRKMKEQLLLYMAGYWRGQS